MRGRQTKVRYPRKTRRNISIRNSVLQREYINVLECETIENERSTFKIMDASLKEKNGYRWSTVPNKYRQEHERELHIMKT